MFLLQLLNAETKNERLHTGFKNLNNLLGVDGIKTGAVTQLYGAPGSGKTQVCYTAYVILSSQYKDIYLHCY